MSRAAIAFASFLALVASGCGETVHEATVKEAPIAKPVCSAPLADTYGVHPLKNKTKHQLELGGTDDLVISAMSDTGCFTLVERDKVTLLIEEMKLCSESNPDKDHFDCTSFAQKGKLLGVKRMVFGDVIFFEENVKGAELVAKVPGIGGIDAGTSYSALSLSLRVVRVEDGEVLASTVVHAVVPADRAGISAGGGGFDLKLAVQSRTPMGESLQSMLTEGTNRVRVALAH